MIEPNQNTLPIDSHLARHENGDELFVKMYPSVLNSELTDSWTKNLEIMTTDAYRGEKPKGQVAADDSFFGSMRPALILAQVFAAMPLTGIGGSSYDHISYQWKHWKTIYWAVNFMFISVLSVFSIVKFFEDGVSFDGSSPVVFFTSVTVGNILLLQLSQNWKSINSKFASTEIMLIGYGYPSRQRLKFLIVTTVFSICALIEHWLGKVKDAIDVTTCSSSGDSADKLRDLYFRNQFRSVSSYVNLDLTLGVILTIFIFLGTCSWNFVDLLLGLISMALTAKLKQINGAMLKVQGQKKPSTYWRRVREEYNAISVLIKYVDQHLQKLMLLSLGSNLFFICFQLFRSLRKRFNVYHTLYFFWSFGFLIARTFYVTICASGIYDESRGGRIVLFSVPHSSFCVEVRRFITQISSDELVLTGCRFFAVTRGLILTIAGTVATYEIVLLQLKAGTDAEISNSTYCEDYTRMPTMT